MLTASASVMVMPDSTTVFTTVSCNKHAYPIPLQSLISFLLLIIDNRFDGDTKRYFGYYFGSVATI